MDCFGERVPLRSLAEVPLRNGHAIGGQVLGVAAAVGEAQQSDRASAGAWLGVQHPDWCYESRASSVAVAAER